MRIRAAKTVHGRVGLPADKSISHRAAILGAIAQGTTHIRNYSAAADCASTLDCLEKLGVEIHRENGVVTIFGRGKQGLEKPGRPLDCGNSGTTMRLLAGVLAGCPFETVLTGDESLRSRPMGRVIEPLSQMGASLESDGGKPPLTIEGVSSLRSIIYEPEKPSAQVKSCILLAGLCADGKTSVTETVSTRDHTERMLRYFGANLEIDTGAAGTAITIDGRSELIGRDIRVPGDISAAAFFLAAAVGLPGSDLKFPSVGVNPTRSAIIEIIRQCGADLSISNLSEVSGEPVADLSILSGEIPEDAGIVIDGPLAAQLIDELPIVAVLGTRLPGGVVVREAAELRVKESDRIAAIITGLRQMGADAEEFDDGFRVGPSQLIGARVDSCGDHRIAMALAVAGLFARGETE
ncbi:MAG TPA: 3-phosphoshikimate 1-carboxyvinyltransferase, partial [Pyrinomonadaceae bacterium]|nr:3-phosphoshikimate 1-carboxyvinyltransferase [Pyrinomonadaceae bacterium]